MRPSLKQLHCLRCDAYWWPKSLKKPERCAKCNSPYWQTERGAKQGRPKKRATNNESA